MPHAPHRVRDAAGRLRAVIRRGGRTRQVLLAATVIGLLAAPVAIGQTASSALDGGQRNPSNNTSSGYQKETQIIGDIAQNAGGVAANTGGYVTRQSNKSATGGGAVYGCRARGGTEACIAANNLSNGDAFRFQASPNALTVGQIRFGLNIAQLVDKPPFATNATGLVKNLNADRVDGKSADDFLPAGSVMFATVAANGTIGAGRGVAANRNATVDSTGADHVFTVPFSADVTKCAATASLAGARTGADPLIVATSGTSVTVTEPDSTTAAAGFHLQVTC
jgi:hypothetical protein